MRLSKQEAKYRIRFIQEHHYNKIEQKIFDEARARSGMTYKQLYKNVQEKGHTYTFMLVITTQRLGRTMRQFGTTAARALTGIMTFNKTIALDFK